MQLKPNVKKPFASTLSSIDTLVLGASGNLGLALCRHLAGKGEIIAGSYMSFRPPLDGVELYHADISSSSIADLVERFRPSKVYHLAWSTNLDECESKPKIAYDPARVGLKSLMSACKKVSAHLIFMSSDGVFGDPECERFEDSVPCPINHYGRGKVEAENRLKDSDCDWTILRACPIGLNPYRDKGLVNWAIQALRQGQSVTGFADSSFTPVSVSTLVREIAGINRSFSKRILHFLSDPPITKYDFLRGVARLIKISEDKIKRGSLQDAAFVAQRPKRQDLQTREPSRRVFPFEQELKLSIQG